MVKEIKEEFEIRKVQALTGSSNKYSNESLNVVIPKKYMTSLGIGKGDYMKIRMDGKRIIMEKGF